MIAFRYESLAIRLMAFVAVIRKVLKQTGNQDFTIQVFHHVEHDMHLNTDGATGTIDPEYLETMRKWLAARLR